MESLLGKLNVGASFPHWKALETGERISGCGVVIDAPNIAVDAVSIWPVRLDSYGNEAFLGDEPLRDCSAQRR